MTPSGECIVWHDGRPVFVPFGLPGEVVSQPWDTIVAAPASRAQS